MQSIDSMSIPQEGRGDGGHLPNRGCVASAKSRPGKNHKISVQVMLSIRIVYVNNPFMTTPITMSIYHSKVKYLFKNGIFQCEQLTIATPGSVLHIDVRVIYYT